MFPISLCKLTYLPSSLSILGYKLFIHFGFLHCRAAVFQRNATRSGDDHVAQPGSAVSAIRSGTHTERHQGEFHSVARTIYGLCWQQISWSGGFNTSPDIKDVVYSQTAGKTHRPLSCIKNFIVLKPFRLWCIKLINYDVGVIFKRRHQNGWTLIILVRWDNESVCSQEGNALKKAQTRRLNCCSPKPASATSCVLLKSQISWYVLRTCSSSSSSCSLNCWVLISVFCLTFQSFKKKKKV